ncbi:MAG: bhp, partial [Proteobacteria bacterium]|nr:bhp [Pseudomonadota bacterium]
TPALNFTGTGSFNYTISDGNGGTATATVTVTVAAGVNYTISAFTVSGRVRPGQAVTISVGLRNQTNVTKSVSGQVIGRRNGATGPIVYDSGLQQVGDNPGGGSSTNVFPAYVTPAGQTGTINWQVTIFDEDGIAGNDVATATTTVR